MSEPKKFALGDYVEVKDRIRLFYETYPDGRLTTASVHVSVDDDVPRVWVHAQAYRTPDDPHPTDGWSWMELPGKTPYTRGSELENTETSAWGRAIGAQGIGIAGSIASANEVRGKAGGDDRPAPDRPELERRASGMQGTVAVGKPPVDMELRETPDGWAWGFKLTAGKKGYQALAVGPLAEALAVAGVEVGATVTVDGHIEMVPWEKAGQAMPPYARIVLERVSTPDWTLPGELPTEQEFIDAALSPEEQAAMDALPW